MNQGGGQTGGAGELHGQGHDVHAAVADAWGKRSHDDPTTYRVTEIVVTGTNPITGYRVILKA